MSLTILGAGAFGTGLAIAFARAGAVTLWSHNGEHAAQMDQARENLRRLPNAPFPEMLSVSDDLEAACAASTILLAVPMQKLAGFLETHQALLQGKTLVACCKGVDQKTGLGPVETLKALVPDATPMILTGPSFAADIARGLPTALTLACADETRAEAVQAQLSTPVLRLYRSADTVGAELGGAFKNVIAIASGLAIGAGLGDSARAAVMTRGFAEMKRFALHAGALPDTLSGLSGFGDLVLTCTSTQSRNYRLGLALGAGETFDGAITVEGAATARAVRDIAAAQDLDLPITTTVAEILDETLDIKAAMAHLLSRPLKEE